MNDITSGFILMVAGMTTVFIFLVLLVCIVKGLEKVAPFLAHMMPDPEPPKPKAAPAPKLDDAVALAIVAALKK